MYLQPPNPPRHHQHIFDTRRYVSRLSISRVRRQPTAQNLSRHIIIGPTYSSACTSDLRQQLLTLSQSRAHLPQPFLPSVGLHPRRILLVSSTLRLQTYPPLQRPAYLEPSATSSAAPCNDVAIGAQEVPDRPLAPAPAPSRQGRIASSCLCLVVLRPNRPIRLLHVSNCCSCPRDLFYAASLAVVKPRAFGKAPAAFNLGL